MEWPVPTLIKFLLFSQNGKYTVQYLIAAAGKIFLQLGNVGKNSTRTSRER
jgi:hypothetical protein